LKIQIHNSPIPNVGVHNESKAIYVQTGLKCDRPLIVRFEVLMAIYRPTVYKFRAFSSGLWRFVGVKKVFDVSEEYTVIIFRV